MTLFVDASALAAIIAGEPERENTIARIGEDRSCLWSAMTGWETVSGLRHSHRFAIEDAQRELDVTVAALELKFVPVGENELHDALAAYSRYGRGRHAAKLNMGDCFAYACAKINDARLLYKGEDLAHTDLG